MNLPIRVRVTLWYAGVLATMIAVLGGFLVLQLRADLGEAVDDEARVMSSSIARALVEDLSDVDDSTISGQVEETEEFIDAAAAALPAAAGAQLLDANGEVRAVFGDVATGPALVSGRSLSAALAGSAEVRAARLGPDDQRFRVHAAAFTRGQQRLVLAVALDQSGVDDAVRRVLVLLLVGGPAALLLTTPAAYWLARKALRPVEQMASDARDIGVGALHERIALPATSDEVQDLAVTLNAMLARIEQGVNDKRRLVADTAHELRTPLAVMRAELDVSIRGDGLPARAREVLESVREEVDRVGRTVDNLLAVGAAEEGSLRLVLGQLDLLRVVSVSVTPLRSLAQAAEVTILVGGEPCPVVADADRLALAVTNLVENALKFTAPGGTVRVATWRTDTEAGVSVLDDGAGIAVEDREHLFDRYYRADGQPGRYHGGSGLGLAICREVALAHGGRIWVESTPGSGSAFFLALPLTAAAETRRVGREEPERSLIGTSSGPPTSR